MAPVTDAAWETVAALAPDDGDTESYRAITKQLKSVGGEGPRPPAVADAGDSPVAVAGGSPPGRLSGALSRTLDIFGWGGSKDLAAAASQREQSLAFQQQVSC